ncbi:MutS-related protein [Pseudobacter ginsenosidimutans]|uniref:MutS-like protein n=1 Tax=Pseudobacter ginsenosidimutans TaxID=661488 RepID=A0A4V2F185_9BACT|nr:DNA mismatch repair protein [Pseudobacter ginsenosidimutans]QEC40536.1 DNA mismatch repair protein [Pseudobacter ginsenosidimutans]RZS72751.1 MutS-like protein [Pseudobacter ginsenosidimutans]
MFNNDKQTIEELNILGKFRQGSVYGLFNQVKTRGGEQLLDQMFRNPLQDADAINERSSVFRFFQEQQLAFPFDTSQLTIMREYVDTEASKNQALVFTVTLIKKILSSITRDERFKKMMQGLQATIVTVNKCFQFVEPLSKIESPYKDRFLAIKEMLETPELEKLRLIDIYQALPVKTLAGYEFLLKGRMKDKLVAVLQFISELDVNITVGNTAAAKGFHYAKALSASANKLEAKNLAHPCVDKAVGNDLKMDGASNVLFLTGANMAGKSTLMKAIGINFYLAHMGFPVSAASMEFSVREGLYSSINVADNIGLGYSHFYAEVVRVKQAAVAAASGKRLLLMFDELFKGTNVKDAYDGTLAVTEGFADYSNCLFIVSTHIIEVGAALQGKSNIQFVYMPTIMEGLRPRYPYKLERGITEDRQGMVIINNEGILGLLNA